MTAAGLVRAPFTVDGTDLPPNLLLIAKLAVVALFFKGYHLVLPDVFAPTVPLFEGLPAPYFRWFLEAGLAVGALGVMFNRRVRACCIVLGLVFILATMVNRAYYRNANFFVGAMFLTIGLDDARHPGRFLAWQLGTMYFGSGLNKLTELDWRTGHYFDYYFSSIHPSVIYGAAAPLLPAGWLAFGLCWSVIVLEIAAGVMFFRARLRRMAVWLGAGVHAGAAMLVGMDYGIFLWVVLASYLLVAPWPESSQVRGIFDVSAGGRVYRGLGAAWRAALWTPAVSIALIAALTFIRDPWMTRAVRLTGFLAAVLLGMALVLWMVKWKSAGRLRRQDASA